MKANFTIDSIKFFNKTSLSGKQLDFQLSNVTILVGPNHSGKSQVLKEIEKYCINRHYDRKIIEEIRIRYPTTYEDAFEAIKEHITEEKIEQNSKLVRLKRYTFREDTSNLDFYINLNSWKENFNKSSNGTKELHERLKLDTLKYFSERFDGRNRFELVKPQASGDVLAIPENHLWALFRDDSLREKIRDLLFDVFNLYFVIDPTDVRRFRIRMSEKKPNSLIEQSLNYEAREFHSQATPIQEMGDGIQAFCGLVSSFICMDLKIALIDEPEAFLHPPLAKQLGRYLSAISKEKEATLIVSTHSSDFLLGCLESFPEANIVRMTFENSIGLARSLPKQELKNLMNDPLLRSTRALQGLFHKSVIVTESETDRAFYDEINFRLNATGQGIADTLFINAQNWQTVANIISPLRALGIPAAGIIDFDTIFVPKGWGKIYDSLFIETQTKHQLERIKQSINSIPKEVSDMCKKSGFINLDNSYSHDVLDFLNALSEHGLFVVPIGELESWLSTLLGERRKQAWLTHAFEQLGSDPNSPDYIRPQNEDVWKFLNQIQIWTSNPLRKGMPQ